MLADANRRIPDSLIVEADQKFFHGSLEHAAVVVHAVAIRYRRRRKRCRLRHRLVLTRQISAIAPDTAHAKSLLWNPDGASLDQALAELHAPEGMLAVIGGPEVNGLFLTLGYDAFHLTRAAHVRLPGGRPVFPAIGPDRTPEDVLASNGLKAGPARVLDAARGVTLVSWER